MYRGRRLTVLKQVPGSCCGGGPNEKGNYKFIVVKLLQVESKAR